MAQSSMEQAASDDLDRVHSWRSLDQWRKKYAPKFDDGFYAESISASVEKMLANNWESLPELVSLSKTSPGLFSFAVSHLGEITGCDNTRKILHSTLVACPKGYGRYCLQIRRQLNSGPIAPECLPEQMQPGNSFKAGNQPLRDPLRP